MMSMRQEYGRVVLGLVVAGCVGSVSHPANAVFTYSETSPMVYDGLGDDSEIDPFTVSSDPNGDVNVLTSLTVQSGTLTMNPNTVWGDKVGNGGTGSVIVNGGTLNWVVDNDNEDRLMLGNGNNGNATVTLNGGNFNVTGPGGYDHAERNVRFGSDLNAVANVQLLTGTLNVTINIPVAFGGKWTNGGTTWNNNTGASLMTIDDGSFVASGGSVFGVGSNDDINFLSTGTGALSILGWTESQFLALATAGSLQIDGADVSDLSGFSYQFTGGQGILALAIPEPASLALLGLGGMLIVARRRA